MKIGMEAQASKNNGVRAIMLMPRLDPAHEQQITGFGTRALWRGRLAVVFTRRQWRRYLELADAYTQFWFAVRARIITQ